MFKYAAESPELKVDCFNIFDLVSTISNILLLIVSKRTFDVNLFFEDDIPNELYGDSQKFRHIIQILLTEAYQVSTPEVPTT